MSQIAPVKFRLEQGTNILIENEKKFEKVCASFSEAGMQDARNLTMFDFRIRLEYFEEKVTQLKNKSNADQ